MYEPEPGRETPEEKRLREVILVGLFQFFWREVNLFSVEGAEYKTCWFATVNQITILKHPMI